MMSSNNNNFTVSDIERYHSGKMSMQERHALEKAALDDPFLADALDGYAFSPTPTEDLVKIQTKLDEKLNRNKVVPLFQKYKWISVAAMVVIIAAAGWLAYSISGNTTDSLAVSQEKNDSVTDINSFSSPSQSTVDSSIVTRSASGALSQQPPTNQQSKTAFKLPETTNKDLANKTASQPVKDETAQQERKDINADAATSAAVQNEAINNKSFSKVENKNAGRNNAPAVEPRVNNVSEPPSARTASENAAVMGKRKVFNENDSVKNINVVLQPLPADSNSLQEVVVVGYGSQKRSVEKYPRVIIDTLEPAEGFVKFDDYVANNLKMPEELKTKTVSGEVQLSFDVNKEGQPINITVDKSLCRKCDEEAVRLLKEGPKWKKKKNKKGKLTIKF